MSHRNTNVPVTGTTGVVQQPASNVAAPTIYAKEVVPMSQTAPTAERLAEKIPTTAEMQSALELTKKHLADTKYDSDINQTGRKIIDDTTRVIDSAQRMLADKNQGEKLQRIAVEGARAGGKMKGHRHKVRNLQDENINSLQTDRLRNLGRNVLTTARLAGMELISSSSFRASLLDFVQLASDVFSHPGETEVINPGARPTHMHMKEQQLSHHASMEADRKLKKKDKKHKSKLAQPTTGAVSSSSTTGMPTPGYTGTSTGGMPTTSSGGQAHFLSDSTGPSMVPPSQPVGYTGVPGSMGTGPSMGTSTGTGMGMGSTSGMVDPTLAGKSYSSKDQLTNLSEAQINALYDRFMDVMRTVARRERSRRVFTGLFDVFDFLAMQVQGQPETTKENVKSTVKSTTWDITHDEHVYNTLKLAQEIFEEFTGNASLDPFLHKMRRILRTLRKDPESRDYFFQLRKFILDILKNPALLDDERKVEEGRLLVRRGSSLSNRKLNRHINGAASDVRQLVNNAKNDPHINNLRRDMKRLIRDVMLDRDGNVTFKPEALDQLRLIIVSTLVQRLKVPLPTINYSDAKMDYTLSNAMLTIEDIVPSNVYVKEKGRLGVDLTDVRSPTTDRANNTIKFVIKGVNLHMPACNLWFRKKTFPKIEDEGVASIDIGGRGVDLVVVIETFFKSADFFHVKRVWCDVHNLRLHLSDTRHDFLYNTFLKLWSRQLKRNMQNSVERRISSNLEQLNHLLKKQVDKSKLPNAIAQRTITSRQ
jgi:hypothetical protein